ncbi:MAG: PorT family protein [Chitinophagales bacterium]|nr:PorT family protein [Chitinophagales bacterium]
MLRFSDKNIVDQKFKEALTDFGVKPSGRAWWNLTAALDDKKRSSVKKRTVTGILFIVMFASTISIFEARKNNHGNSDNVKNVTSLNSEAENSSLVSSSKNPIPIFSKSDNTPTYSQDLNETVFETASKTNLQNENVYATDNSSDKQKALANRETFSSLHYRRSFISFSENSDLLNKKSFENKQTPQLSTVLRKGYLSPSIMLNSTWLYDQTAMSSPVLKYKFTYGIELGMEGGYIISKHWGLAAGWYLFSTQGQKYSNIDQYERTTSLEYKDKSISFTYMNLPVMVQYRLPHYSSLLNAPSNVSLLLGGQYSKMISFSNDNIKGELNNNELFYKNDFAIVTGVDYDLFIDRPVYYTVGIRASYGSNVFNGEVPNDYEFDKPHNLLIGIHAAVNFSLDKNGFIK